MSSLLLIALAGCSSFSGYSPSLTMLRIGEVEVEEPPPIPEALYVPGINIQPEDYELDGEAPILLDLSAMTDLEDPDPLEKHTAYDYEAGVGGLVDEFTDESAMEFDDVEQGAIGDCYLAAAMSAVIYMDAEQVVRTGLVREIRDDQGRATHFVVRFYDAWGDPEDIQIDADLVRKNGRVTYARSMDTRTGAEEWWPSMVEKAYAKWHGGYAKIGDGGWAGDVMQAMTGSTATYRDLKHLSDKSIHRSIRSTLDADRAVVAGTFGEEDEVDYSGTNIYAWHAYSVLDAREADDTYYVTLRNPWGSVEPAGNGQDDGIFELDMAEFRRLYQGLTLGGGYKVDHTAPDAADDLFVAHVGEDSVTLSFQAPGDDGDEGLAARYDVRVCDRSFTEAELYDCEGVPVGGPQTPGTREEILVSGLEHGEWWFAVRVEDESGNLSAVSPVVSATLEPEVDNTPAIPFEQLYDFEGSLQGWTAEGLFHLSDRRAVSGDEAVWMGNTDNGSYDNGSRVTAVLTSPKFDTAGFSAPTILWEQVLDVESGAGTDRAWLEVSTEDGAFADWAPVWEKEGTSTSFDLMLVDLSDFAGQIIKLRFRFDSMDESDNSGEGWIIDDVWTTEG